MNIDDIVKDQEENEKDDNQTSAVEREIPDMTEESTSKSYAERTLIGRVDHFFDKINVAAIELTGDLKVGDTIEIETDQDTIRLKISSMQIDRKDVSEASSGDDVGIKVSRPVRAGSKVYVVD